MPSRMEVRKISELIPYENNARTHPPEQLERLRRSMEAFGFVSPVLIDGAGHVIAGHGRIEAAKLAGIEEAPCVLVEHLSEDQRRAYILADNRLAEMGEWDRAAVAGELQAIQAAGADLLLTGFDEAALVLPGDEVAPAPEISEDDFDPEPPEEPVSQRGQVWQLGRHRLMCGDATCPQDVDMSMGGVHADICFTSPPYNMAATNRGGWSSAPKIAMHCGNAYNAFSDCLTDSEYSDLLTLSAKNALAHADDVMYNLSILAGSKRGIVNMLHSLSDRFSDVLIWNKSRSMPFGMASQRGLVSHRCELVLCFNQTGNRAFSHPQWGKGTMINRIDTDNGSANKYSADHAATFPVEFAAYVVTQFSDPGAVVLDPFGGTGTTLIACEQTGRRCCMLEIDPHYCDLIIRRWEEFTGEKAVLVHG